MSSNSLCHLMASVIKAPAFCQQAFVRATSLPFCCMIMASVLTEAQSSTAFLESACAFGIHVHAVAFKAAFTTV